jgi:hypothetical protein
MLNKVAMKKTDNAKNIFKQISLIKNCYNSDNRQINNDYSIVIILDAASYEYQAVLTGIQMQYGDKLSMLNLKTVMKNAHWRSSGGANTTKGKRQKHMFHMQEEGT